MPAFLANRDDRRHDQNFFRHIRAQYSDCGSFCFLQIPLSGILDLNSNFLEKMRAKIRVPAVWGPDTSYNGRFYSTDLLDGPATMKMYQYIQNPDRRRHRDTVHVHMRSKESIAVNITVFPTHLASASKLLVAGKDGDDYVRVLFLPDTLQDKSGPPEIKVLRVTLNQILAKLEETARMKEKHKAKFYSKYHQELRIKEAEKDASEDSQEISADVR